MEDTISKSSNIKYQGHSITASTAVLSDGSLPFDGNDEVLRRKTKFTCDID